MQAIKPKKSLAEQTYDVLVDAICTREIQPGDRLNQDDIAARLNVSRQPVNSAIAILRANGLVEDTGRRGVVVRTLEPAFYQSVYEYRLVVEPLAVELAVARRPRDARAEAEDVMARGRAAVDAGDMASLQAADRDFHEMLYGWSQNEVIQASMRTNWHHIRRAMAEVLSDREHTLAVWDEHEAILAALFDEDAPRAGSEMRRHIQIAYDRTFRRLGDVG